MKSVDLIIRPYNYSAAGGKRFGITAYLKALYVVVDEDDDFAYKYLDVPDIE